MHQINTRWALERILELDLIEPGLAGSFLRASSERRHVIAAFLARRAVKGTGTDLSARLLMKGTHNDILVAGYGKPAPGFRSALRKSGSSVQPRSYYRYLHALLSHHKTRSRTIRQLPKIDLDRLKVLSALPEPLRAPRLVMLHKDTDQAHQSAALYRLLSQNGVDDDALTTSLRSCETQRQLSACWLRWAERTTFPENPIPACTIFAPVRDAQMLKQVARSYRNCARRYLTDLLDGVVAFGLFRTDQEEVIVHLRKRDDRWWLEDCYSPLNQPVPTSVQETAAIHLASCGITRVTRATRPKSAWEPLRDIAARWEFDHHGWG